MNEEQIRELGRVTMVELKAAVNRSMKTSSRGKRMTLEEATRAADSVGASVIVDLLKVVEVEVRKEVETETAPLIAELRKQVEEAVAARAAADTVLAFLRRKIDQAAGAVASRLAQPTWDDSEPPILGPQPWRFQYPSPEDIVAGAPIEGPCLDCPFKIDGINTTPENATELVKLATSTDPHPCHRTVLAPLLLPCRGARQFCENIAGTGSYPGVFDSIEAFTAAKTLGTEVEK